MPLYHRWTGRAVESAETDGRKETAEQSFGLGLGVQERAPRIVVVAMAREREPLGDVVVVAEPDDERHLERLGVIQHLTQVARLLFERRRQADEVGSKRSTMCSTYAA